MRVLGEALEALYQKPWNERWSRGAKRRAYATTKRILKRIVKIVGELMMSPTHALDIASGS
jgi:hypothetical protein